MTFFNKDHLPLDIQNKQKFKRTFDSPCQSVCDYQGEEMICRTCAMKKKEKNSWKKANHNFKRELAHRIKQRQRELLSDQS